MDDKLVLNINGEEKEFNIVVTFKWTKTDKYYVVYTDYSRDEENNVKLYAATYNPQDLSKLTPVETEEEWNHINEVLQNG